MPGKPRAKHSFAYRLAGILYGVAGGAVIALPLICGARIAGVIATAAATAAACTALFASRKEWRRARVRQKVAIWLMILLSPIVIAVDTIAADHIVSLVVAVIVFGGAVLLAISDKRKSKRD